MTKVCDRCRVPGCLLDYGGNACHRARQQECPDVVFTNADMIRQMTDEELADFLACTWSEDLELWQTEKEKVIAWLSESDEDM